MKKVLSIIGGIVFVIFVCYVCYNSFVISGAKIDEYIEFGDIDEHGQTTVIVITPKNELLCYKMFGDVVEKGYYKIVPFKAKGYFGLLYKFERGLLKFRILPRADMVCDAPMKLEYKEGSSFPNVGESFYAQLIVWKDKVEMNRVKYQRRIDLTEADIESIEEELQAIRRKVE